MKAYTVTIREVVRTREIVVQVPDNNNEDDAGRRVNELLNNDITALKKELGGRITKKTNLLYHATILSSRCDPNSTIPKV